MLPFLMTSTAPPGRSIRLEPGKDVIDLFFRHRALQPCKQAARRGTTATIESHLCALGESFASFAVKIFYRKGRKEKPQSSQRKTFAAEIFHVTSPCPHGRIPATAIMRPVTPFSAR